MLDIKERAVAAIVSIHLQFDSGFNKTIVNHNYLMFNIFFQKRELNFFYKI
jgi:hypothetical protein